MSKATTRKTEQGNGSASTNRPTRTRLLIVLGFGGTLALFVALLSFGNSQVDRIHDDVHRIVNTHNTKESLIRDMHNAARERVMGLFVMAATEDPFERDEVFLEFNRNGARFARARIALLDMELTEREQRILEEQGRYTAVAVPLQNQIVELIHQEQFAAASELLAGEALEAQNRVLDQLSMLVELQRDSAARTLIKTDERHTWAVQLLNWLGMLATALGLLIALLVGRRVLRAEAQLRELNTNLEDRVCERTRDLAAANDELAQTVETLTSTQKQLVQSEKLASLGSLVAGISHEINTPIGIAVTSATNIQEESQRIQQQFREGGLTRSAMEAFLEHLAKANHILLTNLQRASNLIGSFKQVAVDQSSDEWRLIDLHDYCDEILVSLHPKLKRRPIQVRNDCPPACAIYTHPGAIYQIISNLVLNSLTHAFAEQQPGNIDISAAIEGREVLMRYTDDGRGIADGALSRVFDPFYTTQRGAGGSGLGLNIVHNLVTGTLGGTITVRNRSDGGVCFEIRFPYRSGSSAQRQAS